jgi:hypothetical protein
MYVVTDNVKYKYIKSKRCHTGAGECSSVIEKTRHRLYLNKVITLSVWG